MYVIKLLFVLLFFYFIDSFQYTKIRQFAWKDNDWTEGLKVILTSK